MMDVHDATVGEKGRRSKSLRAEGNVEGLPE